MNRIYLYSTAFGISLAIFIISGLSESLDGLIFLAFLFSSIYFVFAHEELPKAKLMKNLEVRQYHEKRVNIYGYIMSTILIGASILFTILSIYLKLRLGFSSLIIWFLVILSFTLSTKILGDKVYFDNLCNYINEHVNIEKSLLRNILIEIESHYLKGQSEDFILKIIESKFSQKVSIPFLHETYSIYIEYKLTESNTISPDEISEMNK